MKIYDDINDPILKYFLNPDKNENNKFLNAIVNQNIKKLDLIFSLSQKEEINPFSYLPGYTRQSNPIVSIIKSINKLHKDKVEPESIHKWIAYLEKNGFNLLHKEFSVISSQNNNINNDYLFFKDIINFSFSENYILTFGRKYSQIFFDYIITDTFKHKLLSVKDDSLLLNTLNIELQFRTFSYFPLVLKNLLAEMTHHNCFENTFFELPEYVIFNITKSEEYLLTHNLIKKENIFCDPVNLYHELLKQIENNSINNHTINIIRKHITFNIKESDINIINSLYEEHNIPFSFLNDKLLCPPVLSKTLQQREDSGLSLSFLDIHNYNAFKVWFKQIKAFNEKQTCQLAFNDSEPVYSQNCIKLLIYLTQYNEQENDNITLSEFFNFLNVKYSGKDYYNGFFENIHYQKHLLSHSSHSIFENSVEKITRLLSDRDISEILKAIKAKRSHSDISDNEIILSENTKKISHFLNVAKKKDIVSFLKGMNSNQLACLSLVNEKLFKRLVSEKIYNIFDDILTPELLAQQFCGEKYHNKRNKFADFIALSLYYTQNNTFNNYNYEMSLAFIQKAEKFIDKIMAISEQDKHAASLLIESVLLDILTSSDKLLVQQQLTRL